MKNPKVSVLCATYNRHDLIRDNIESFLEQDYKNSELIIIDDGGTDNTKQVIESYNDDRLKYYWKENGGIGSALYYAVEKATGDLICICSDDDMLFSQRSISLRVACFKDGLDYICTSTVGVDGAGNHKDAYITYKIDKERIWGEDYINTLGLMWRSDVHKKIGNFDTNLKANDDWDWKIRLFHYCKGKVFGDIVTAKYRIHGGSRSRYNVNSGLRDKTEKYIREKLSNEFKSEYMRILVTQPYGIGNIINATPLIDILRRSYPKATIDLVCNYAGVLKGWKALDNIYETDKLHRCLNKKYDVIYCCVPRGINVVKAGFKSDDIRTESYGKFTEKQEALINLDMFKEQKIKSNGTYIPMKRVKIEQGKYIGISAGWGGDKHWAIKNWGYNKFADLIELLRGQYPGYKYLILGIGKDRQIMDHIDGDDIINCVDKYDIQETAYLISKCKFVICNDTGLAHVSGAVGTRVYVIFGATSWVKNKPYSRNAYVIKKGLRCQPCQFTDVWQNGKECRCKTIDCMNMSAEYVFKEVSKNETKLRMW